MRSFENGRQVSGETARRPSQALRLPQQNGASLPPAIARSTTPWRTSQKARPRAWAEDEQAVDRVKAGPVIPSSIDAWAAPALAMIRGMIKGWKRLRPSP